MHRQELERKIFWRPENRSFAGVERESALEAEFNFAGYCAKPGKLLSFLDPQAICISTDKALLSFFF